MTIEAAQAGFAFATVRPRATRDNQNADVNLVFIIEEGQRAYIERINVRGNTRTRDYVIRREFDIAEGDAYNRALVNRAERRLKNLGYFKIGEDYCPSPARRPTASSSTSMWKSSRPANSRCRAAIRPRTASWPKSASPSATCSAAVYTARPSVQYGQYARGFYVSFVEPYFLGYRVALGLDIFGKEQLPTNYVSYSTKTVGLSPGLDLRCAKISLSRSAIRSTANRSRCRIF